MIVRGPKGSKEKKTLLIKKGGGGTRKKRRHAKVRLPLSSLCEKGYWRIKNSNINTSFSFSVPLTHKHTQARTHAYMRYRQEYREHQSSRWASLDASSPFASSHECFLTQRPCWSRVLRFAQNMKTVFEVLLLFKTNSTAAGGHALNCPVTSTGRTVRAIYQRGRLCQRKPLRRTCSRSCDVSFTSLFSCCVFFGRPNVVRCVWPESVAYILMESK